VRLPDPPLLIITDRGQACRPLEDVAAACFAAGCRWLSLREKDMPPEERLALLRRLVALGRRTKLSLPPLARTGTLAPREKRPVLFDRGGPVDCPVYDREKLKPGDKIDGPALISEYASTTVFFPGDRLTVADTGELIITVGQAT